MGSEKDFTIVNMKFRNIFLCFYRLPLARVETSESSNIQVHPPSSEIMVILTFLDLSCLH
jgi:hypothetical protein